MTAGPGERETLIRGGTVIDGTGAPARVADIRIRDGRIVAVGRDTGPAERTIEADGAVVVPGFVDIHTHYDGQATWDERLLPSAHHGVTTVVMSNCGVGFAPVRPRDRDTLIELMEGVEDIPGTALHEGLAWDWETFPEFLDALDRRRHDIDLAAQVPHSPLRLYVMGDRGAAREPARAEDIAEMGRLAAEGVRAGALGFTTSNTVNHRALSGDFTPTLGAARVELEGIARAIGATGSGVFQLVSDLSDLPGEFETLRGMVACSGRPLSISVFEDAACPQRWRETMAAISTANDDGLPMRAQVATRGVGLLVGLQGTLNPLKRCPSYRRVAGLPLREQVARLAGAELRDAILSEYPDHQVAFVNNLDRLFELGDPPDYEPEPSQSIAAAAGRAGRRPHEVLYDCLLKDDGRALLYLALLNYEAGNLDVVAEMLEHPHAVPGLSDGGAHVTTICDASFPTTLLAYWGRDRVRGRRLDAGWLVSRQTRDTARAVGLADRGVLAPGYKADLNVVDWDRLGLGSPTMVADLPAGGRRLLQPATGYLHTLVSGVEVYRQGEATGELPGRLVRGPQPAPAGP